jgi:hypothetical protein
MCLFNFRCSKLCLQNIHILSSYIKGQCGHLLGLSLFVIVFILYTLVARDERKCEFWVTLRSWIREQFYVTPCNLLLSHSKYS